MDIPKIIHKYFQKFKIKPEENLILEKFVQ